MEGEGKWPDTCTDKYMQGQRQGDDEHKSKEAGNL